MPAVPGVHTDLRTLVRLEHAARGFSFLPRQPVGSVLAGRHSSRLRGRGMQFEELRAYVPGDDVRSIDWRVTARTRKTHVRVHSEEKDRPVLLVVDQRQTMFFGTRRAMKSVVAAEAAALAAWRTVSVGDRIGAFVVGENGIEEIRPRRSKVTVQQILGAIVSRNESLVAGASTSGGEEHFVDALARARAAATHDHLVVIVSDFTGDADVIERHLALMTESNDVLLIFVYDTAEANVPEAGNVVVSSGELQAEIDTDREDVRLRFRDDFDQRVDALRRISRRHGLPTLTLETAGEVVDQIRHQLGAFQTRGR